MLSMAEMDTSVMCNVTCVIARAHGKIVRGGEENKIKKHQIKKK